ncbi:MAG: hypothetical protein Q7T82_10045 [Armatimonadota bacterium]|nr:hypothetical protein [Armatimonadota bacterium]
MRLRTLGLVVLASILLVSTTWTAAVGQVGVVLNDTLQGSTTGTRNGGVFAGGGWQSTDPNHGNDYIYWHLPHPVSHGRAEFYVKGLSSTYAYKGELFHMYDNTYQSADTYYWGYRNNPYKMYIRKSGTNDGAVANSCELVFQILGDGFEPDTPVLSWDAATNYHFIVDWGPDGNGNTYLTIYRDSTQIFNDKVVGNYTPAGHSIRIAACRDMGEGSIPGAIFSYVKVTDLSELVTPPAAAIVQPGNTQTITSRNPTIKWHGEPHTSYQVRVNTSNDPNIGVAWDSGQVSSVATQATTGTLANQTTFYPFVRIGTATGWSNWSAAGFWFKVDTSYVAARRGRVVVSNSCLQDDGGKFLALGFTHMRAMHRCRGDKLRYQHDLCDMASKGFNYQRILSMVGWDGLEIAPVTNEAASIWQWEDYQQQFKDAIDIAYDNYGIRTQITIFADAQNCMPNGTDRTTHMNNILSWIVGREHKIILIEVANEYYQNGLSMTEVKDDGAYLAARTTIPIALSDPGGSRSNADIQGMYLGAQADIATVHFPRDSDEYGWFRVRDPWRVMSLYPGVAPVSSNEPAGPASSGSEEIDPTRLCSAASFCWIAHVPMYVYHGRFGTSGLTDQGVDVKMSSTGGFSAFLNMTKLIPADVGAWTRNDGIESAAPFTVYCWKSGDAGDGQANTYWTEYPLATKGCHRNIGAVNGPVAAGTPFVCYTQGVLSGGVTLKCRDLQGLQLNLAFTVYNAVTGAIISGYDYVVMAPDTTFTLPGSATAYLIKGIIGGHPRPDAPTNFTAANNGTTNNLSWTNPPQSYFVGTMVRFRTDGYPTSPTDGTLVCNRTAAPGSNDSFAHTGVSPTGTYYYSGWSYDEVPNYCSTPAHAVVGEDNLPEWINDTFDNYNDGPLGGQGGWETVGTASAQVQSAFVKDGIGKAVLVDTVPTGQAIANQKRFQEKSAGNYYMSFDVAQDAAGTTGQIIGYISIYGSSSSTEIAKLHIQKGRMFMEYGSGLLATLSTTIGNLTWNTVKIGFNADTRKFDLWLDNSGKGTNYSWKGIGTNISRIVISSDRNSALNPQKAYIDNVKFEPKLTIAGVTDDGSWSPSLDRLHFNIEPVAGANEYQYAIGTSSGGTQIRGWTSCGTSTDYTASGLSLNQSTTTYYISAQATMYGNWGPSANTNGIKVAPAIASIQAAKALADGAPTDVKALRSKNVTGVFPGSFYIQEPGSPCGLKIVSSASVAPGNEVDVCGVMKGSGAERYMDGANCGVIATTPGPGLPETVSLPNTSIGGAEMNSYSPGVVGGIGPNNLGLYITAYGVVTQRQTTDPKCFYIDDGCGLRDGTTTGGAENVGVRVVADPASYPEGCYVAVTGISSCFDSGGLVRQILPVNVQILRP